MKKRGKKWRKGLVPDEIFGTFDFSKNSQDIRNRVAKVVSSFTEAKDGPAIARSFPAVNLPNAELFLEEVKRAIVDQDMRDIVVDFELAQQEIHGRKRKTSPIMKAEWTLDFNFDNISIPLLENIFNNPDYVGDEYRVKQMIAQTVVTELQGIVPKDRIAIIPTSGEMDNVPVIITNLAHKQQQEMQKAAAESKPKEQPKASPTGSSADKETQRRSSRTPESKPQRTNKPVTARQPRTQQNREQPSPSNEGPTVTIAKFDVLNMEIAAPEDQNFVAYCLNERKPSINQELTQLGQRLTQDIQRRVQLLEADYHRDLTTLLGKAKQELQPDVAQLRADKVSETAQAQTESQHFFGQFAKRLFVKLGHTRKAMLLVQDSLNVLVPLCGCKRSRCKRRLALSDH